MRVNPKPTKVTITVSDELSTHRAVIFDTTNIEVLEMINNGVIIACGDPPLWASKPRYPRRTKEALP